MEEGARGTPATPCTTAAIGLKSKTKAPKEELVPTERALESKKRGVWRDAVKARAAEAITKDATMENTDLVLAMWCPTSCLRECQGPDQPTRYGCNLHFFCLFAF
jgi:hypothetical protein